LFKEYAKTARQTKKTRRISRQKTRATPAKTPEGLHAQRQRFK